MTTLERQAIIHLGPWILFDGRCTFCSRGSTRLGPIARRRGFRLTTLQSPIGREFDIPGRDEMKVITREGTVIGGVEAFAYICRHVWWATPFAWLWHAPFCKPPLKRIYRWIAANRYRFAGTCQLTHTPDETPIPSTCNKHTGL